MDSQPCKYKDLQFCLWHITFCTDVFADHFGKKNSRLD